MKKLLLMLVAGALILGSCKDKTDGTDNTTTPKSFTSKVALEYFSGAWCQFCPDGKVYSEKLEAKYNTGAKQVFIPLVVHVGDQMEYPGAQELASKYTSGYPLGMVNRISGKAISRADWEAAADEAYAKTAKAGIAIDCSQATGRVYTAKVKVAVGGADLPEGTKNLMVYLVAKERTGTGTGWDQVNYYNTVTGHPMKGKGNPIVGYIHTNSVIKALSANLGDVIPSEQLTANKTVEKTYTFDTAGWDLAQLSVIAVISNTSLSSPGAYNAQKVAVGAVQDFD